MAADGAPPHGIKPRWAAGLKYKGLSREAKDAFRKINLRWHDLRHEYASRLVERGVRLAQVRDLLGHASITTTERYDNQKLENLQIAAAKLEGGLTFEPTASESSLFRLKPEATGAKPEATRGEGEAARASRRSPRTEFQESFKITGQQEGSAPSDAVPAIEPNELNDLNLRDWLGVRDDFRNWLQLGLQPAKGYENRRQVRMSSGESGEVGISHGASEAEQLCDPERA